MLSVKPQNIDDRHWYYEEETGLIVVHQVFSGRGKYVRTEQFTIPWRMVERSVARRKSSKEESDE